MPERPVFLAYLSVTKTADGRDWRFKPTASLPVTERDAARLKAEAWLGENPDFVGEAALAAAGFAARG